MSGAASLRPALGDTRDPLTRIDGKPTVTSTCECGLKIVHITGEFWATARSSGRSVYNDGHWHKPPAP